MSKTSLSTGQGLLPTDRLRRRSWDHALRDVAAMAQEALAAETALVAIWAEGRWSARTAEGQLLDGRGLGELGASDVLEAVRRDQVAVIRADVLAAPIRWWEPGDLGPRPLFGACLYLRGGEGTAFGDAERNLALDVVRLAEPVLNALRALVASEEARRVEQQAADAFRALAAGEYRLGLLRSFDAAFGERVLEPLRTVAKAARVGLFFVGPPGAGKSSLARGYHFECPRAYGPFVELDCVQAAVLEAGAAELFGLAPSAAVEGAPPGGRRGKLALADGGTLVLDDVAALPPELQERLLRFLDDGRVVPVGGTRATTVDVQILATATELPERLVERGQLREDLYWRLCDLVVEVPPLDERPADIPTLAGEMLHAAAERFERRGLTGFTEAARVALVGYAWSQLENLRGLEQVVTRAVLAAPAEARRIDVEHLRFERGGGGVRPPRVPRRAQRAEPVTESSSKVRGGEHEANWRAAGRRRAGLRRVLERKLREHEGDLDAVALDAELRAHSGHGEERVPQSTLYAWLRDLDLKPVVKAQKRAKRQDLLVEVTAAIREHGTASAAARALGMPRNSLVWQLRRAGKTVADVLGEG